jgi:acetyl esterase/lipase
MAEQLEKNGVFHETIPISGGGHGFDHDMNDPRTIQAFDRVIEFLKRWVK